jgi:hypothetical protein
MDITETKVTNSKNALGSSLGEDGFRDNFCMLFNDTYQMISPVISLWAIKIVMKCKHLSNLPTVTLCSIITVLAFCVPLFPA